MHVHGRCPLACTERLEPRTLLSGAPLIAAQADNPLSQLPLPPNFSFKTAALYAAGNIVEGTSDLAAADLNGDTNPDLVTASWNADALAVLLGRGDGTFSGPTMLPTPGMHNPHGAAVADLDGDHKPDVVVGGGGTNDLLVFMGNGDGSFRTGTPRALLDGAAIGDIEPGDFDRDGKMDLAVGTEGPGGAGANVSVLLGKGDGTFKSALRVFDGDGTGGVVAADFNHDDKLDLAIGALFSNVVHVFRGLGDGTFQPAGTYPAPGPTTPGGVWLRDLAAGDFSGDGNLDLAAINNNGSVSVLLGHPDGTFDPATRYLTPAGLGGVALGDFNGDGKLDVACASIGDGTVVVFPGRGDGTLAPLLVFPGPTFQLRSMTAADFDRDGRLDLAAGVLDRTDDGTNAVGVWTNDGGRTDIPLREGTPYGGRVGAFTDASSTGNSADYSVSIDWGDGSTSAGTAGPGVPAGYGLSGNHTYADDGAYVITAHVHSVRGDDLDLTTPVTVARVAPALTIAGPDTTVEGAPYLLTLAARDPGADTIRAWSVDWGDGTVEQLPGDATQATHAYEDQGQYVASATASDEDGSYNSNTLPLAVAFRPPAAALVAPAVSERAAEYRFVVNYSSRRPLAAQGVDSSDVRVTGPNGYAQTATLVGVEFGAGGTRATATYRIIPPGSGWDRTDDGTYTVAMLAGQVSDASGTSVPDGPLGQFTVDVAPAVVGRYLFYNRSAFDAFDPLPGASDDAAIAPEKAPLLAGQASAFSNVSGYSRGINGLMVDLSDLPPALAPAAGDFQFRVGAGGDAPWGPAPEPESVTVRRGAGVGGSDRVTIVWADRVIMDEWLQVAVPASSPLGLRQPDVFSFGSLVGETGNGTGLTVNAVDLGRVRAAQLTSAGPSSAFDVNRDGRVNAVDLGIVRACQLHSLRPIPFAAPAVTPSLDPPVLGSVAGVGRKPTRRYVLAV